MPNGFDLSRLRSMQSPLFGGNENQQYFDTNQQNQLNQLNQQNQPQDILSIISKLYQPSTQAMEEYLRTAKNVPQTQEPSKLQRVGAVLSGLGTGSPVGIASGQPIGFQSGKAFETTRGILEEPYQRAIQRWQTQLEPLRVASQQEEQQNVQKRLMAEQTARNIETERLRKETERKDRENAAIRISDMQRKVDEAEKNRDLAQQKFETSQKNFGDTLELHRAEMNATNARFELGLAQKESNLQETIRQHNNEKENWDKQRQQYDERLKLLENQLKQQMVPTTTETTTTTPPDWFGKLTRQGPTIQKTVTGVKTKGITEETKPQEQKSMQKPIPGIQGGIAESTDGGKTWYRIK